MTPRELRRERAQARGNQELAGVYDLALEQQEQLRVIMEELVKLTGGGGSGNGKKKKVGNRDFIAVVLATIVAAALIGAFSLLRALDNQRAVSFTQMDAAALQIQLEHEISEDIRISQDAQNRTIRGMISGVTRQIENNGKRIDALDGHGPGGD